MDYGEEEFSFDELMVLIWFGYGLSQRRHVRFGLVRQCLIRFGWLDDW